MAEIAVGQMAPDFTLSDENGDKVRLSDQRGHPAVLVFLPAAFSPVCTTEMCAYRDDYSDFEAKGARVFSISHDSRWTLKAWKDAMGLKHTLLSDTKGEVAKLYGCWNEELGLAERLTVVVDKDSVIRYVVRSAISQPRDQREALAAIT
jgi:mycoredoxin-dependent peroxiredoxin